MTRQSEWKSEFHIIHHLRLILNKTFSRRTVFIKNKTKLYSYLYKIKMLKSYLKIPLPCLSIIKLERINTQSNFFQVVPYLLVTNKNNKPLSDWHPASKFYDLDCWRPEEAPGSGSGRLQSKSGECRSTCPDIIGNITDSV